MLHIKPIFAALLRNRIAAGVIAVQIALTLAIIANCAYLVSNRISDMGRPSGLDEDNLLTVVVSSLERSDQIPAEVERDLAALRQMPGVVNATTINALPLSGGGWSFSYSTSLEKSQSGRDEDGQGAAVYFVDEHGLEATGSQLSSGRFFTAEEIDLFTDGDDIEPDVMVVSDYMAEKLFPGEDPLGKLLWSGTEADSPGQVIVGTVAQLQSPWTTWDDTNSAAYLPIKQAQQSRRYLIRTEPERRAEVMGEVEKTLAEVDSERVIHQLRSYDEIRARGYRNQHAMAWILIATMVALALVTSLGIVGMASFWVTQRIKQIGTRRALGARRFDVRSHFQVENGLISAIGVVLGVVMAYGLNIWLVSSLGLPSLPLWYLPIMAVVVFILGQISVLGPARRASKVSPAVATRTV